MTIQNLPAIRRIEESWNSTKLSVRGFENRIYWLEQTKAGMTESRAMIKLGGLARFEANDVLGGYSISRKDLFTHIPGVYLSKLPFGGCTRLYKVLLTNRCMKDCRYCANRAGRRTSRYEVTPKRMARRFIELNRRGIVEGLFLSSGVPDDPEQTMERIVETGEIVRRYGFEGYVHLKIIPGAPRYLVERACELADRVSLNLEAPSRSRLEELASQKDFKIDMLRRLRWISKLRGEEGYRIRSFTTQYVVGAAGESDKEILIRTWRLYKDLGLWRAYFMAFEPIPDTPLAKHPRTPLVREHRLYQADFLLRYYGFRIDEILSILDERGNLPLSRDPKLAWALENRDFFPVDVNEASYEKLLRVPGIGPRSARKIIELRMRGERINSFEKLRELGVVVRRARPFLRIEGSVQTSLSEYLAIDRRLAGEQSLNT